MDNKYIIITKLIIKKFNAYCVQIWIFFQCAEFIFFYKAVKYLKNC